jgi:hypothetical protein
MQDKFWDQSPKDPKRFRLVNIGFLLETAVMVEVLFGYIF